MIAELYYLIRSQITGKHLVATQKSQDNQTEITYLLLFSEHFHALSYLNTHAQDFKDNLLIDSISASQLKVLIKRWDFDGLALVKDPLLPDIDFMSLT